nr:hypothetical protein [Tanacetum cinerariifolium]
MKYLTTLYAQKIRSDKIKDGLGYSVVPPPVANLYLSPKKDLSWTGLPEFTDDTVTDYSKPSPTVESTSEDGQNRNYSASKNGEPTDSILSKPAIKFLKAVDRPAERPTANKAETRVQRLERELKARAPIHKEDRGRSRHVFPLSVMSSHCQKKFPLLEEVPTARVILPLVCTAGEDYSQSMMRSSQSMSILGMYGVNN